MAESNYVYDVTEANFESQVAQASFDAPVLVDFWAPWCQPCQMLAPVLAKLADEYQGNFTVAKINTDEQQMLAMQFGVRSLPTVKIVKEGKIVDEFMGAQPESAVRQIVERHAEMPARRGHDQVQTRLAAGDIQGALRQLQAKVDAEPDNHDAKLDLAAVWMQAADTDQARAILDALPLEARESDKARTLIAHLQFADAVAAAPAADALAASVAEKPGDLLARYQLGARQLLGGNSEIALEQFFEIMKRDRQFEDDLGRKSLVAAFNLIDDPKLVTRYRQRMASLLF